MVFDNEFGTGVNGFEIIYCDSKNGLVDHAFKGFFLNSEVDFFVNGRKLRKFFCFDSDDVIFCGAAFDFCDEFFVAFNFDFFGVEAAYHIKEKLCVKYNGAVFGNAGGPIS